MRLIVWRAASLAPLLAVAVAGVSCSVGQGEGSVTGSLVVEGCDADLRAYDMKADFFAAQIAGKQVLIRIQKGGDLQEWQDNLVISVNDATDIRDHRLDQAIPIELERPPGSPVSRPPPPVQMSLSLRGSCGSRVLNPGAPAQVVLHAVSGVIHFQHMLDPKFDTRDTNAKRIEGDFEVVLKEPRKPDAPIGGTLRGNFKMFYQRGGPAQPFP